jgi:hypothetical protein
MKQPWPPALEKFEKMRRKLLGVREDFEKRWGIGIPDWALDALRARWREQGRDPAKLEPPT